MKSKKGHFKIHSNKQLKLSSFPTTVKAHYTDDKDYKAQLENGQAQIGDYQALLYAAHSKALLIVFQGMDTAGKDGAIAHVMSGVNPQGCHVVSFKTPTTTELEHDFFWRANQALPARGQIGIFNRSYYEETLITQVHPKLLQDERLPTKALHNKNFWQHRYEDILNHEKYLHRQGFDIIKIFLHISKQEQKKRLLSRFGDPKKMWKIEESDIHERAYWKQYQKAYQECIRQTSTGTVPWYIVPADDKKNARLMISDILLSRFKKMNLEYPKISPAQKNKLKKLKDVLEKDS